MTIRVDFDPHALDQMAKRGFTEVHVRWLLDYGQPCYAHTPARSETRHARCGKVGDREAKVVFLQNPVRTYVITVMWVHDQG
jgi:hypothetical protein